MPLRPYISFRNLAKQFHSALLLKNSTQWKYFYSWLVRKSFKSIPVASGAVGMGCIGYGYHAVWEVTEACNLRCKHCHATSDKAGPDELTTKEGIFFIDGLSGMKQFQMLVFSGGEPMIRPDIETLLAHSKKRGLVNVIATNGTLIDKSRAKDLKSMGVKGVAISLDSTDPVIHNSIRNNPKSFALAMKGIEACKTAGMVLQINFTAMKITCLHLKM